MKQKIMTSIKKILSFNYKQYIKTNIMFLTTVISLLVNATLLRFVTVKNYFAIKPLLADLAIILIITSFAYLLKPKKRVIYYIVESIILTTICIINSMYYTFYSSFASVSLLATSIFVVDVGDAVVKNVLQLKDFIYLYQPLLLIFVHLGLVKKPYYKVVEEAEPTKRLLFKTLITATIIYTIFFLSLTPLEFGRLVKQWNREFLVMKFGLYTYQVNDIIASLQPKITAAFGYDNAVKKIRDYYTTYKVESKKNKYTNIFKGKNIIVIHAESIQQFTMDLKFNGQDVTPNLNRIASEGLYFSNYYSQVGVGTSSDSEFTFNTSLLPVSNGTVFVSYWDRDFITTPKLLKEQNYYSFSMHANNGTFWNRSVMHKQMGYDKFYHKTSYQMDDIIGLGLSDKSFFRQSVPIIKQEADSNTNFYCTMIMLSNHTPFDDIDKYGDFPVTMQVTAKNAAGNDETITAPYMEGTTLGNYFKAVHYADATIGEFISELDQTGILDNTVIVIYGDHDARLAKADYERLYNYDPYTNTVLNSADPHFIPVDYYEYELNRKVPFIIWSKSGEAKGEIKKVMGMVDALPTLGNMFDFHSEYELGHDIFSTNENVVIFPNGNWLTDKMYYNSQKEEHKLLNNDIISQDYINKYVKYSEDTLQVTNDIILYDYIKKSKETAEVLNTSEWK